MAVERRRGSPESTLKVRTGRYYEKEHEQGPVSVPRGLAAKSKDARQARRKGGFRIIHLWVGRRA